ncbi:DUF3953 domain-containing protein [Psychrobacillus sp. INOP01]|uniref:DUF3953 domain-containing protein n=1 Tax=Psychrobacillus sp. INOP01 TaxID=2829187 RepID=UPI001BA5D06B|nr:DUF3953 domain-containing protein [Psychrobacillus sp. INOP01]QUG40417.1 DUF3953 domain-containing protein [Psychrobacillus sp. INOP01]
MKITRIIFAIIAFSLSSYSLISRDFELMPIVMMCLGAFMLATGLSELQKDRKRFEGYLFIIVSLFIFSVTILGLLLN